MEQAHSNALAKLINSSESKLKNASAEMARWCVYSIGGIRYIANEVGHELKWKLFKMAMRNNIESGILITVIYKVYIIYYLL